MGYCTAADVYAATSLTVSEVAEASVEAFIKSAEKEVDRVTFTTYWNVEDSGTATAGGNTTLTETGSAWTVNGYAEMYVWIYGGTGEGQVREIVSNTADVLTVDRAWETNPDTDSTFRIIYTATPAYFSENIDGDHTATLFLDEYPLRILESLSISDTSITTSNVFQYNKLGKLILSSDAEKGVFDGSDYQQVDIAYWWGVYKMPYEVKRYCVVTAAINTLSAQMGSTHNIPSTYSLPEGSVTVGQAYINIKGTWDTLMKEKASLAAILIKYPRIL
jgi:hypothetical protein